MDTKKVIDELNSLIQLDIDASEAYKQALKNIDVKDIYEKINQFCLDHERHIVDLTQCVRKLNGTPIERTQDLKGFLIEGFTAIRSATGTEGALKAMKTNEKLTNSRYNAALSLEVPPDIKEVIERNYADERRHLEYIENVLATRPWEVSERV